MSSKEERFQELQDRYTSRYPILFPSKSISIGKVPDFSLGRSIGFTTGETTQTFGETNVSKIFFLNGVPVSGTVTRISERPSAIGTWNGVTLQPTGYTTRFKIDAELDGDQVEVSGDVVGEFNLTIGTEPKTLDEHLAAVEKAQSSLKEFLSTQQEQADAKAKRDQDTLESAKKRAADLQDRVNELHDKVDSIPDINDLQDAAWQAAELLEEHKSYRGTPEEKAARKRARKAVEALVTYIDIDFHEEQED